MRRLLPIILILALTSCVNKAVPDKPVPVSFSLAEPGEEYFADLPDGILPTELPEGLSLSIRSEGSALAMKRVAGNDISLLPGQYSVEARWDAPGFSEPSFVINESFSLDADNTEIELHSEYKCAAVLLSRYYSDIQVRGADKVYRDADVLETPLFHVIFVRAADFPDPESFRMRAYDTVTEYTDEYIFPNEMLADGNVLFYALRDIVQ